MQRWCTALLIALGVLALVACGGTRSATTGTADGGAMGAGAGAAATGTTASDPIAADAESERPFSVATYASDVAVASGFEGEVRQYYGDDEEQLSLVAHYRDGRKHGEWISYHANGQVFERGAFVNGRKDGPWVVFYPSGQKLEEGAWDAGRPVGTHTAWLPDGTQIVSKNYGP